VVFSEIFFIKHSYPFNSFSEYGIKKEVINTQGKKGGINRTANSENKSFPVKIDP
jgi:hypothetical protein